MNDLGEQCISPDPVCAHDQRSGAIHRGSSQPVAGLLLDWNRFARDHRLIHAAGAIKSDAIHRDLLAGSHPQPESNLNLLQWHIGLGTVIPDHARSLGRESQQRSDGGAGLAART